MQPALKPAFSDYHPGTWFSLLLLVLSVAPASAQVDFKTQILPLLEKRCYECHGEKKQKGGLRLDRKSDITKGGDSGEPPMVAGKDGEAPLIARITSTDSDEKMPPKGERLTPAQIELLKTWIAQGAKIPDGVLAEAPKHWAYQAPQTRALPEVKNKAWVRNGLDQWVLARLEKENLPPSPEADPATLLRRVSLDLTGIPPTLEQVDAFLADRTPQAYEKAVDRLLASPQYGERWARPWLDLARYADTQGYEKDNRRSMWPYRDWVIGAFNADMPFDQFTIEQIAGDLLPNATQAQRVATGFHRNTMTNTEGGTDNEEFRYEALVDRVNTTFAVWMGSTMQCAQCHNHKYDPLQTKEYYQALAFFDQTADADKDDESPTMKVYAPGQEKQIAAQREALAAAEKKLADHLASESFNQGRRQWEQRASSASATLWSPLNPAEATATNGVKLKKAKDGTFQASGENPDTTTYTVTVKTAAKGITGFRLEAMMADALPHRGPGRAADGNFVVSEFKVSANGQPLALVKPAADFEQEGWPVAAAIDGNPESGWAISPQSGKDHQATFALATPLGDGKEITLVFEITHQTAIRPKYSLGKFRLSSTTSSHVAPTSVPPPVVAALAITEAKRDPKQIALIADYYSAQLPEAAALRDAIAKAKKVVDESLAGIPSTSVMVELTQPRVTHRHIRGAYLSLAEVVTPGTPASLHPFPKDQPLNRLGFARWLVSKENPLTARVMVNRFWEQYFGKGLVDTVEEFGHQGDLPTHPELLDWLALDFMNQGWKMKTLHKLIVTSATYRQSSKVTAAGLQADPANRLLARGPRVRLEAEQIRDQALQISGLLSSKVGGPSVMPPQPDGLWAMVYSGDKWQTSAGEDKYRRGLYTFWRRSNPYPMMVSFDAPSREFCVLRRNRSNTPLQALNTLNDPAFIETAQAFARRIHAANGDLKAKLTFAFRSCLARNPQPAEIERVIRLYQGELAHYQANPEDAKKMASSEIAPPKETTDLPALAAWTVVANVLLNLDETITKG